MKASPGNLTIETEKDSYFQGELLKGNINIKVNQELKPTELLLKLKGKESNSKHKLIIVSHQFSVLLFKGSLLNGEYNYPFSLNIPKTFPASIDDKPFRLKIQYKIKGDLLLLAEQNEYSRNFHYSKILYVKQTMRLNEKSLKKVWATDVNICCFHAGTTLLNFRLEKNYFKEGETIHIRCYIDNSKCRIRFKGIFFKLIRRIERKNKKGLVKKIDKTISINIHELRVDANSKDRLFSEIEFNIANDGIGETLYSSTNGHFFKSSYILKIAGYHDYYLFTNTLSEEEFPIIIYEERAEQGKILETTYKNEIESLLPLIHLDWEQAKLYLGKNKHKFVYPEFYKFGLEMSSTKLSSLGVHETNKNLIETEF
jgi:hypothetical protein